MRELSDNSKKGRITSRVRIPNKLKNRTKSINKSYHLPLPDNKVGNILSKRVRIVPKFIKESFKELKQVEWPDRKTTAKLSFAVILFSIVFGIFIATTDFLLDKLFKEVILKK